MAASPFPSCEGDEQRRHRHVLVFYGIEPMAAGYADACSELSADSHVVYKRRGLDLGSWRNVIKLLRQERPDVILLHSLSLIGPAAAYARMSGTPLVTVDHLSNQVKQRRDWAFAGLSLVLADRSVVLTPEFAVEVQARLGPLHRASRLAIIAMASMWRPLLRTGPGLDKLGRPCGLACIPGSPRPRITLPSSRPSHGCAMQARAMALRRLSCHSLVTAKRFLQRGFWRQELALGDQVEFLGMLPESALPEYLRSLDIFVQSSFGETMSTAVMQAMAAGLPVVATDVPGLRNMIRPGETGLLFPLGDDAGLARILDDLRRNPGERLRLGDAALEHARRHWSHATMFRRYEEVLRSLRS